MNTIPPHILKNAINDELKTGEGKWLLDLKR